MEVPKFPDRAFGGALQNLRDALGAAGEHVYLVGGVVRDALRGDLGSPDIDLTTTLDPFQIAKDLHHRGMTDYAPVEFRNFCVTRFGFAGEDIELTGTRAEAYDRSSRKPTTQRATLAEDASRRDFTINALYARLSDQAILDPTGHGLEDLRAGLLRTPRPAEDTFAEDPLRMLRAVRFRTRLGFKWADGTDEAIAAQAHRLAIISRERIRDELSKIIVLSRADEGLADLMDLGLLDQFAPEFRALVGCTQGDYHHLDAWDHTRLVVRHAPPGLILRLAALFHDVGKGVTRQVIDGRIRFLGHETTGAEMTVEIMTRLKFSNAEIEAVSALVRNHMRQLAGLSRSATRRLVRQLGNLTVPLLDLADADSNGHRPDLPRPDLTPLRTAVADLEATSQESPLASPLDGRAIMAILGAGAGPVIGAAKAYLLDLVLDERLAANDTAGAELALREWARTRQL